MTLTPCFQSPGVTLYHGDCLEVLSEIETADALILDPPYSMSPNSHRGRDDGAAGTCASPVRLLTETLAHARRILTLGGIAALICDWRRLPDVAYLASSSGLRISTCVAWTRSTPGLGGLFRSAWDPVLILSHGTPLKRDRAGVRNVIEANKPRGGAHPYEKPVALWRHILDRLPPNRLVVDPFCGSGSGLVAALESGHRAIGIEVDEVHCAATARRLAQGIAAGLNFPS